MKKFGIKISDYFEYKRPNYLYLKLIPSNSIRNYNSDKILSLIAGLYRAIDKQIRTINKKLFFECNAKVSYYIYMERVNVQFFFIVPETHYNLFKDKIIDVWQNKITITQVNEIPLFNMDCTKFYMTYKKEDAMSLSCDKRDNILLNSLLNTIHIMEKGDKVGVFYNFSPIYQKSWRVKYDRTIQKLKEDIPINKNKFDALYIARVIFLKISDCIDTVLECVNLGKAKVTKPLKDLYLSDDTKKKRESVIVKTQILCFSQSDDNNREYNNAISTCQSFQCLDSDNMLVYRKYNNDKLNVLDTTIKGADTIKIQTKEGQNFLLLPAKELLEEYKIIEHTNVLETQVPLLLQSGYISLGINVYKSFRIEAFLRDNYDQGNFPLVPIGEQGSGKTTFISNYVDNTQKRKEACIIIDFIRNCELSDVIESAVPKENVIVINMADGDNIQGIGYNELKPKSDKTFDMLKIANRKALYIQMLIDALNINGDPLSSSMDRYLSSASNIVFTNENASLKDVIRCLNDHEYREKCINNVPLQMISLLEDEIAALKELNEYKDNVVVGTREYKIDGVNHRINTLRKDLSLKVMFNKGCENNVDLVKAIDEGKVILFKMPQDEFPTPQSKNVIVTYLLTKIWCAALVRGSMYSKPKRFHVIVDEIFQAKTAMQMLKDQEILPQTRKFGCKFVVSCQDLGQISILHNTLKGAGASYMLMKGSGKNTFNEFKEELYPYTLDDLEALPQWSSLNIINYEEGRAKFVTELPKPLK
jgi:hypothetical protein